MKTFEEFRFSIPHNKVRGYKYSPSTKAELIEAIEAEIELQGPEADLNCIDTSEITDMSQLFDAYSNEDYGSMNVNVSDWIVSNVEDMSMMFNSCSDFNCDISRWDVSNVENMQNMFTYCASFDQDLSSWNVSKVKYTNNMFVGCQIKEEYKPKFN